MSTAPPLRAGVVGCGYQGTLLAQAAARTTTVRVTACVDPDLRLATELADRSGHRMRSARSTSYCTMISWMPSSLPHHTSSCAMRPSLQSEARVGGEAGRDPRGRGCRYRTSPCRNCRSMYARWASDSIPRALGAYAEPTTICPRLTEDPILMMLIPEVEEFGRAIAEDRQPVVRIRDARRVLGVLDAAIASARTRKPVRVNDPA